MQNTFVTTAINEVIDLPDDQLSLLLSCAKTCELRKGQAVLKEGEICRSFYLVEKGYLRTHFNKNGLPINLDFTFEGNFTSNLKSYRNRKPSEVTIEAGEDALVWIFCFDPISQDFESHPQVARFIRRLALRLLLSSQEHSDVFKIYTPTERYRYIEKNNPLLLQRISLSQIASYVGVTRETLSRIRAKIT
jgi:CRP-like cAMP-binding protein